MRIFPTFYQKRPLPLSGNLGEKNKNPGPPLHSSAVSKHNTKILERTDTSRTDNFQQKQTSRLYLHTGYGTRVTGADETLLPGSSGVVLHVVALVSHLIVGSVDLTLTTQDEAMLTVDEA